MMYYSKDGPTAGSKALRRARVPQKATGSLPSRLQPASKHHMMEGAFQGVERNTVFKLNLLSSL